MNYLLPSDYDLYGLELDTNAALVAAASALIDAHCRRRSIAPEEYRERLRLAPSSSTVRVTYLPLVTIALAASPILEARARYGPARRGESYPLSDLAADVAIAFGLPGDWAALDLAALDVDTASGDVTLPRHPLGLGFNEVEFLYTAGHELIPEPVKHACAHIVRNALATPALNVRSGQIDRMHLEYFSDSLLDSTARALLTPYVAQKVA